MERTGNLIGITGISNGLIKDSKRWTNREDPQKEFDWKDMSNSFAGPGVIMFSE